MRETLYSDSHLMIFLRIFQLLVLTFLSLFSPFFFSEYFFQFYFILKILMIHQNFRV